MYGKIETCYQIQDAVNAMIDFFIPITLPITIFCILNFMENCLETFKKYPQHLKCVPWSWQNQLLMKN